LRSIVAVVLALLALPALASAWGHYENGRFGFAIDVPPGFAAQGESFNGDGNRFTTPTAELRAFAGYIFRGERTFETEAGFARDAWGEEGYALTYQVTTPRYSVMSGKKGARVLYERLVAICGGDAFMGYSLEYSVADMKAFDSIIDRLSGSLKAPAKC
jgi:hypothetical protein